MTEDGGREERRKEGGDLDEERKRGFVLVIDR
jgi:hypothetical protein